MGMEDAYKVLLKEKREMTVKEISEITGLTTGSVTKNLERLIKWGQVKRRVTYIMKAGGKEFKYSLTNEKAYK